MPAGSLGQWQADASYARLQEAQRNNQSALESSITLPLPTYRPESQLTKRKNVLRSDAALRKNCVFQEKCASDWTHKFLKNASLLIKKGPKRTNAPKIRSLSNWVCPQNSLFPAASMVSTHKLLKNAFFLIKKGPKRTNAGKIRSLNYLKIWKHIKYIFVWEVNAH